MKIDLYAHFGSPLGVTPPDIYGRGVGGAELAMMSWAKVMAERGHGVTIYNDAFGRFDGVHYLPRAHFKPDGDRDVFVAFRGGAPFQATVKAGMRVFWSCDQYTYGDYNKDWRYYDRVVGISPRHLEYFREYYNPTGDKLGYFDLGVLVEDYEGLDINKVPGRLIFCSVPGRGLDRLSEVWPIIKAERKDTSLVITSDYTLWGGASSIGQYRRYFGDDVLFLGNVPRRQLVKHQLAAEVQCYPCTYDELFCISAAECQVAGAVPVTTDKGALKTTNFLGVQFGSDILDDPSFAAIFARATISRLGTGINTSAAKKRFDWQVICAKWEHLFNTGEFV